ncbi:MAG: DUF2147 domain-containing protein [Acinetobacter sp.]|nr:DUF2147 domain-containing protein [Acinetobacter sp.]MBP8071373.1 DUF2147 domain-containing protein [Acinetobacter sp.]
MGFSKFLLAIPLVLLSNVVIADEITGIWQQIDDRSGTPKAIIQIRKESNASYTGKVIKLTPRAGYTPRQVCKNCPAPYTNKPILGLDVIKGLVESKQANHYDGGKIIDPLSGKLYSVRARLNESGKRLTLRAFVGVSSLGRSQTWIRLD